MVVGYPTDLAEAEGPVLESLLPLAKPDGRPRATSLRKVVEAIFSVLRSGCPWRLMLKAFPPDRTEYVSKGYEALCETSVTWIRIAMIQLLVRRLAKAA